MTDFIDAAFVIAVEKTVIRGIINIDSIFYIYHLPGKENIFNIFSGKDYA
ncbi:MAG: hypothetical protein LBK66_07230 [Spirochaetaceae bacterium]|nr:hypothetical protein [Spirochaetaceae bacterium]